MNIITVKELTKTYTTYKRESSAKSFIKSFFKREKVVINAVDGISFEVEKGSITGILGPNGAGKSTTIKMLCGALFPTEGQIDVMGFSPAKERQKYVKKIGAVFGQKSQLIFDIPPIDSFAMNQAIYNIPKDEYEENLNQMVELFDIADVIYKPTRVLSLGERMKCEFVMAMLHKPEIVFLDEPTIGLDVIAKSKIREFIKSMNERGTTFILTTHDLEDVEQLAEKVIIINHGKKVFDNNLENLKKNLGNKKIITLTLEKEFTQDNLDGMPIIKNFAQEKNQISLEIDLDKYEIQEVLSKLSGLINFTDISVKELPMDMIITRIYQE